LKPNFKIKKLAKEEENRLNEIFGDLEDEK